MADVNVKLASLGQKKESECKLPERRLCGLTISLGLKCHEVDRFISMTPAVRNKARTRSIGPGAGRALPLVR